jgi:nucleotide-binding universal stress UspA family protein
MATVQPQERPAVLSTALALRVLAVIDGSERTGRVLEYVQTLAENGRPIEVVLLGVVRQPPDGRLRGYGSFKREEIHARLKDMLGQRAVGAAGRRLDQFGIAHEDRIEVGDDPAETVLRVAAEETCGLIVVGDPPMGVLQRWLPKVTGLTLPTTAGQVAKRAPMPVVTVK